MFGIDVVRTQIETACSLYEHTAPVVADHCNDLYIRINERPDKVTLAELLGVCQLWAGDEWMQPNLAANTIYHLRHRLGMDTTGMIDH